MPDLESWPCKFSPKSLSISCSSSLALLSLVTSTHRSFTRQLSDLTTKHLPPVRWLSMAACKSSLKHPITSYMSLELVKLKEMQVINRIWHLRISLPLWEGIFVCFVFYTSPWTVQTQMYEWFLLIWLWILKIRKKPSAGTFPKMISFSIKFCLFR